ncbi:protein phosphatase inhibitor [Pycnococcus provasolii]
MASSSAHAQQPPTAAVNTPVDAETQNKHITWDEQNLEYNEANRTATMTIDEPPTPYLGPLNLDDVPDGGPPSLSLDDDFALDGDAPAASGAELQPPTPAASAHEPNGAAEPSTTDATGAGAGAVPVPVQVPV